jgi:hypothetical protein
MGYFFTLFFALFFSALFLNMKITTIISLMAYKTEETQKSAIMQLIIMSLAIFFIALLNTLF